MLDKTVGILVNRLVIGFVFAFIYQAVTGAATSALSIPLTGTIQDLITGLESADQAQSAVVILWWVISTILFTFIATQLVRHRKRISRMRCGRPCAPDLADKAGGTSNFSSVGFAGFCRLLGSLGYPSQE